MLGQKFGFRKYTDPLTGHSLKEGDPLLDWANDPNLWRMFGVGQLGLSRIKPEINPWTRARHSMSAGLLGMAIAENAGLSIKDQQMIFVKGIYHDPHPAGGDGMKLALGISEADVAHKYWFSGAALLRFERRCREMDWNPKEMETEIMGTICRTDTSVTGRLVHGPDKGIADADFMSYTMADLAWGSARQGLNRGPRRCDSVRNIGDCDVTKDLISLGLELELSWWGIESGEEKPHHHYSFSYDDFDPVGKVIWDRKSESWVFRDSEILCHLTAASAVLHESLYFHPAVQGPELMLKRGIEKLGISNELGAIAMESNDADLREALLESGLGYWLSNEAHQGWEYREVDSKRKVDDGEYVFTVPKFNLRLDTPVLVDGQVFPFRDVRAASAFLASGVGIRSGREMLLVDKNWSERPEQLIETGEV